jgi:hypothetical protein
MKYKIATIVLLVALVAVSTIGAFAYWSSARTTHGTIQSGTLDLKLSTDGVNFTDNVTLPWDTTNIAPGDQIDGTLYFKNVGTVDAVEVTLDWSSILNNPATRALADHLFMVYFKDNVEADNELPLWLGVADTNGDSHVSLTEMAALSDRFAIGYDDYHLGNPFLPAGETRSIQLTLEFDPAVTGMDLQGTTTTYDLVATAWQKQVFP